MKNRYILALAALAVTASAAAQEQEKKEERKGFHIEKTSEEDREMLFKSRPHANKSIPVPSFVVKSASGNFYIAVGGQVNTIFGADIGNNLYDQDAAAGGFTTCDIPVPSVRGHRADIFINPLNADIDFQAVGLPGTENEITGYIRFGTPGNTVSVNLKRAYLTYRGFTIGQKLTLFQDQDACQPTTIDPEGPSGTVSQTAYEIGYKSKSYNGFRFAVALDMPTYYNGDGVYHGKDYREWEGHPVSNAVSQTVPDIPFYVEWSHSENNRIRLSGLVRNFRYNDLVKNKIRDCVGWGVMLSGNLQPVKPLTLYLQAVYGEGIGSYIQDLSQTPVSYVPSNSSPGKMKAAPMMGINIGASYKFNNKWQVNAVASQARIWNVSAYANALDLDQNYKYALYACGNCLYNITSYLQVGVEYLWGRRMTWDHQGANDNRLEAQILFTL